MPELVFPPEYDCRVLALEAPGGAAARVDVVVPSVTRPGEAFDLKLAVLDAIGYPAAEGASEVCLLDSAGRSMGEAIRFAPGCVPVATLRGVVLESEGLFRFAAQLGGQRFCSNPTCCTSDPDVLPIFWGDPHVHTVLSQCHADKCRSTDFCYSAARYLTGLDWVAAADHVSNGRCELARFRQQSACSDAHDDPPNFVTLPAYEASLQGGCGGDCNVYMTRWPEMFVDEHDDGNVRTLCERFAAEQLSDGEFFVVPHHTTRAGKHGEIPDAIYPGPQRMPLMEIHSKWGTSEYRGNPNPLKEIHPGPSYAQDFLARGLVLGFIAGTDTHATMPSGGGIEPGHIDRLPGLTAVRCDPLTRQNIFEALQSRSCYAASGERIYLDARVQGCGVPRIDVTAGARGEIARIEIVRNGAVIAGHCPGSWQGHLEHEDADAPEDLGSRFYYARVTCVSGAQAWSSPVWVCGRD